MKNLFLKDYRKPTENLQNIIFVQKKFQHCTFNHLIKTVFTQSKALIEGRGIGK